MRLKKGQRWQENDKRFHRVVEIIKVDGSWVDIQTIRTYISILTAETAICRKQGRKTRAAKKRFNGKSQGYSLLDGFCHECQLARGAKVPKGGLIGVTVSMGTCSMCLKQTGLVPSCDYGWPDGRKAVFD